MARALTQRHRDTEVAKVRLGDCFDLQMGKTPARANDSYWGGANKWISIADIGKAGQYIGETKEYITDEAIRESGIKQIPANTLLMSFKLSIGKATITKEPMFSNEAIMAFFPKNPAEVDLHYFYHQISNKDWSDGMNRAVAGLTLNKKSLQEHKLVLPPLAEQKRIAGELDRICELKKNAEKRLALMDQLVKSKFVEMFGDMVANPKGWPRDALEHHVDVLAGYPFDSSKYVDREGVRICGGIIIMPGYIDWSECKRWPKVTGYEQYLLAAGDIVMALDRPWISAGFKIAQLKDSDLPALLIQRTARIRGVGIDQGFLLHLLNDKAFEKHCTITGSLVPHISHKDIKSYEVILPPLSLQREFAAFVESVDKSKAALKETIATMETLYKERLQEYFS